MTEENTEGPWPVMVRLTVFWFVKTMHVFICLAVLGLSCSTRGLLCHDGSFAWCRDSLVLSQGLSSCGEFLHSMWDLLGPKDWTGVPCIAQWILSHQTTREMLDLQFSYFTMVQNSYICSRLCTSDLDFWSFRGLVMCGMVLLWW